MALRLLIVRFSSLGDVILTTPLLRAIRARHPDAEVTFVTKRQYAPVLQGNPAIRDVVSLEPGQRVAALARRLADRGFDHRLDLHGSLRSALLRRALGGDWTGYDKRRSDRRRRLWLRQRVSGVVPVAERYFEAARSLGVEPDGAPAQVFPAHGDREAAGALVGGPYVVLAPGSLHRTKRWPAAHWSALAALMLDRGFSVVGAGTHAESILLPHPGVTSAFGASLGLTAALMSGARVVVGNDSGLTHLATAVRVPVVALFGPTVREFGFAPYRSRGVVLEREMGCRPCSSGGSAFCPLLHHRCLRGITPDAVAQAALAA